MLLRGGKKEKKKKSNVLHKKVSDKCPKSIEGALVPRHQNTSTVLNR